MQAIFFSCMGCVTGAIITELADGGTLEAYVTANPNISVEQKKKIIIDVASGLKQLHSLGICHGDLFLFNVFMVKGTAKLGDFGKSTLNNSDDVMALEIVITGRRLKYMSKKFGILDAMQELINTMMQGRFPESIAAEV
jgi:serine/threonine protein kinase